MLFETKEITLRDGTKAILRSPRAEDAAPMMAFMKTIAGETDFILRTPEECNETDEQEAAFLEHINTSEDTMMIMCEIDGHIAGNCQIKMDRHIKCRHRGRVAIGLEKRYWRMGIGTALFEEMIAIAKAHGLLQLELEYIEGNERAKALYEKMGFRQVAEYPDAIRLTDGRMLKEFFMMKKL